MLRPLVFSPLLILLFCGLARADSLTDNLGPRSIALGDSMRAEAVGTASTVLNPAGLALNHQLAFEASYGYRQSEEAKIGSVAACDSTTPVAGCFYYHYLSESPTVGDLILKRRLHEAGITAARKLSEQIMLGINTHYFDYNSNAEGDVDQRGYSTDLGLLVQPSQAIRFAAVGYNLFATDIEYYPRGVGTGIVLRPGDGNLGISMDALWNLDRAKGEPKGRYGGGIEYLLSPTPVVAYPLRAGAVYDALRKSSYASFGVGYSTPKMGIDIGGRKQVSGTGEDLVIQVGLRLIGPTPRP